MTRRCPAFPFLATLAVLAGCAQPPDPTREVSPTMSFKPQAAPPAEATAGGSGAASVASLHATWAARKLIRGAALTVEVDDVAGAAERASRAAAQFGGVVSDSESHRSDDGRRRDRLVLKVPSARFDAALAALAGVGTLRSQRITTQDVTKAYADLETRLAVKRQSADRLRRLLTERTGNLGDVLAVERELDRLIGEIEQMEGERRFYDHEVAISTITLELVEPGIVPAAPGPFAPLAAAFRDMGRTAAESLGAMVRLVAALAPWLLLGIALWWFLRRARRRRVPA